MNTEKLKNFPHIYFIMKKLFIYHNTSSIYANYLSDDI